VRERTILKSKKKKATMAKDKKRTGGKTARGTGSEGRYTDRSLLWRKKNTHEKEVWPDSVNNRKRKKTYRKPRNTRPTEKKAAGAEVCLQMAKRPKKVEEKGGSYGGRN